MMAWSWRSEPGRWLGAAVLALLLGLLLLRPELAQPLRLGLFDSYQRLLPRSPETTPAVIVAIDEASLAELGQWPWPRHRLAALVERIAAARPAVIGIDMLFPEPDRTSPEHWLRDLDGAALPPELTRGLQGLPSHDLRLAVALARAPVVLGVAGLNGGAPGPGGPVAPVRATGGGPLPFLQQFSGALRSLPRLDRAAKGHGLLTAAPDSDGVIRRLPLLAGLGGQPAAGLAVEMLRLAAREPGVMVQLDAGGLTALTVGPLSVPLQDDGAVWLPFGRHAPGRFVSAADVLAGRVPPEMLDGRLVLVGLTGLGLLDRVTTPLGEQIPGVEVHAQALEVLLDGGLLQRPRWAPLAEAVALLLFGAALIALVPALPPVLAWLPPAGGALLLGGGGLLGFAWGGWLLDVATPLAGGGVVFVVVLGATLWQADRRRKALAAALERERLAAAVLAGELAAARRIQMSMLPAPESFPRDPRIEVAALIEPARHIGGDLYEVFLLDEHRLFVAVGDVSGKGVPASLFMALGKALLKSVVLRHGEAIDAAASAANAEISRDNAEMMFITLCAALVDLRSGVMTWVNAGHDAPYVLSLGAPPRSLSSVGGPPLCMLPDFPYPAETCRLAPGDTVVLVTDGITEAQNAAQELFGRARLEAGLRDAAEDSAGAVLTAVRDSVARFVGDAEPADDLTILAFRWLG